MNYCTAIAFRQSLSSLALQAGTLLLVANAFPEGMTIMFSFVSNFIFLKKSVFKNKRDKRFALVHCHKISAPCTPLMEVPCLVSRKKVVL